MNPTMTSPAVEALVDALPTTVRLRASTADAASATGAFGEAVVATFVGAESTDLALVLLEQPDLSALAETGAANLSATDTLRPALEAAAATLGPGVLGDARIDNAGGWVTEETTALYALSDGDATVGWFAIRSRAASHPARRSGAAANLGRIRDVEMSLAVELGRTRMSVRDVLSLEPGSVIELDRSAGAPADVLLNGRLIAHGEIVVVDQDYAVRITRILDVAEGEA